MPVSEDEFERPVQMVSNPTPMSKAEQRKSNKPIMEKRRRARINHCLNELKTLILDAMKKDPARHSKLEKADILEMTVKHLQQIQRQQLATAVATDPAVIMRFKSGFDECAAEVSRYINRLEGIDNGVKQRLTAHLHRCVSNLQHISTFPHQNMFSAIAQNCDKSAIMLPNVTSIPGDVNNNSNQNGERIQIQNGLQLIPSRLPTGELALLVPNSNHLTSFFGSPNNAAFQFPHNGGMNMNSVISPTLGKNLNSGSSHPSAFTAVIKNQEYPSPTSTADVIKKETNSVEEQDCKVSSFPSRGSQTLYLQNYNLKVTEEENVDQINEELNLKNTNITRTAHNFSNSMYNYEKFKTYGGSPSDGTEFEQKTLQKANSSSFQRTLADSTTSFLPPKEQETYETGFKPFQVEIPNSHLKAHISISKNFDAKPSVQVHQKPNPNFTLNPNKLYQKSPYKFSRNHNSPENNLQDLGKCEIGFEKFTKIEPICTMIKSEDSLETGNFKNSASLMRSSSSETFQSVERSKLNSEENFYQKPLKREYLNKSPEILSPTSSEPPPKTSRLSLNVTLTDDQSQEEEYSGNRCKRISVIVEDSSKSNGNEDTRDVAANVSSQKDMWRPW